MLRKDLLKHLINSVGHPVTSFSKRPDGDIDVHLSTNVPKCDFCSDPNIVHDFHCTSFEQDPDNVNICSDGPLHLISRGDWAACAACRDLILADKREELLDRQVQLTVPDLPEWFRQHYRNIMERNYADFRARMTGHSPVVP